MFSFTKLIRSDTGDTGLGAKIGNFPTDDKSMIYSNQSSSYEDKSRFQARMATLADSHGTKLDQSVSFMLTSHGIETYFS